MIVGARTAVPRHQVGGIVTIAFRVVDTRDLSRLALETGVANGTTTAGFHEDMFGDTSMMELVATWMCADIARLVVHGRVAHLAMPLTAEVIHDKIGLPSNHGPVVVVGAVVLGMFLVVVSDTLRAAEDLGFFAVGLHRCDALGATESALSWSHGRRSLFRPSTMLEMRERVDEALGIRKLNADLGSHCKTAQALLHTRLLSSALGSYSEVAAVGPVLF